MSDRIIQGFSEMKNIYLTQILNEEKKEECEDEDYGEKYEKNYKKTGKKAKKDWDGDGELEDEADEYAGKINKAIREKRNKKEDEDMKTESFSNWRNDLNEVISKIEPKIKDIDNEEITEKNVKNKVVINPPVTENFVVIDSQELDEEFILETINIASGYFVSHGLNEHGLEMVIESLGEEKFLEYVFYVAEDSVITEARRSGRIEPVTKAGKPIGSLSGGGKASAIRAKRKEKAARDTPSQPLKKPSEQMTAALRSHSDVAKKIAKDRGNKAVTTAVQQQNPKAETGLKSIAQRIGTLWKNTEGARNEGWKRHDAVANTINSIASNARDKYKEGIKQGKTPRQALSSFNIKNAVDAAHEKYKEGIKHGKTPFYALFNSFDGWVGGLIDEGYDLSTITAEQLVERYNYLLEKAVSEHQQKLFGLALSVKRGQTPRSDVSKEVLEIVDGMSTSEIRKFAGTTHKGLPATKD